MCFALRPEGIEWPRHDSGIPSFRLEDLTKANHIAHEGAHDALADVRATIGLARLLRKRQPRLVDWALRMRSKANANRLLDTTHPSPVVYTSSRVAAKRGCTSLFLPLLAHPTNRNAVIAFDLMADPGPLLKLEPEAIRERVFVAARDMPEGVERIPLQEIRVNQVPMLAPVKTLRNVDLARIGLEPERCDSHARRILEQHGQVRTKLFALYGEPYGTRSEDPDLQLYGGGFFSDHDKHLLEQVRGTDAQKLAAMNCRFEDPRLPVMLFRYRARNFPETLSEAEHDLWETERLQRLLAPGSSKILGLRAFRDEIARERAALADDARALEILGELETWAHSLGLPETGNTQ
jgi:exodeoxyribonuclease-1